MEKWFVTTLLLCSYGFFKELRPSEPFLTEYLTGPKWHNITAQDVYQQVYPVWTYSYLVLLFFVFLVTDLLRYKPVIVVEGIAYVATWSLLLWARGVFAMQIMEFAYGIATSTEVAYYTYIYAKVPQEAYKAVTSYTRAAILTGRFGSGLLAQVLTSTGAMDYAQLNYLSLGSVVLCLALSLSLPAAKTSVYFHRDSYQRTSTNSFGVSNVLEEEEGDGAVTKATDLVQGASVSADSFEQKLRTALKLLWTDAKYAYSRMDILKWSIWWAFGTCGNFQVGNYIQPLWEEIAPFSDNEIYNGGVEAVTTLLGAAAAFGVAYVTFDWDVVGDLVLAVISGIDALTLVVMSQTDDIWVAYVCYVVFRMSYQTMITIISYQVAKEIRPDSYGLIFGINVFFALFFQTILTIVVVEPAGLGLTPRSQFAVYGGYFGVLGLVFLLFSILVFIKRRRGAVPSSKTGSWNADDEVPREEPPVGTTEAY